MLSHKTSVNKCKKIEIIPSIISDHNGMKLATNYRRKTRNFTNMWTSNNTLKQPMDENGNQKGNLRISWEKQKLRYSILKLIGCIKSRTEGSLS